MRSALTCACVLAAIVLPISAESPVAEPDVTVVLEFRGAHSPQAIQEMEREAGRILQTSGLRLQWKALNETSELAFNDLVLMTFKGACVFSPIPPSYDELGPYALTRTTGGEVQPFGEVDCDHVASSIHNVMSGYDYPKADLLLGRALGRVVAHELVHMLTRSKEHGHEGVHKPALSARQLIAESLPLSALDIDRLQAERHIR